MGAGMGQHQLQQPCGWFMLQSLTGGIMARTALMLTALLLSIAQPSYAQEENAWDKFLREQRELTAKQNAELKASQAQSDREYRELQQRLRTAQPLPEQPATRTIQPQVKAAQPEQPKTRSYLVSTGSGMKLCRETAGVVTCN